MLSKCRLSQLCYLVKNFYIKIYLKMSYKLLGSIYSLYNASIFVLKIRIAYIVTDNKNNMKMEIC
jgi:hypothetical protein